MRIAFISTILGYPWGGADSLWTATAAQSIVCGHEVFLGVSPLTAAHSSVQQLIAKGAKVFYRDRNSLYLGRKDQFKRKLLYIRDNYLEQKLSRFRPDVVVINQGATYDALAESYLIRWLEKTSTSAIVICENNPGSELCSRERKLLQSFFACMSKIFFVSELNLEQAEKDLHFKLSQAQIIQNPLIFEDTGLLPLLTQERLPIALGLVGRLDIHHKGLDILIRALAPLAESYDFTLTLTGRNETPELLEKLISDHGLNSRIRIRPFLSENALIDCYREMELFLLPSRYEGCATTMLEALCCGRPVLATPVGGVKDWIVDGLNGYVTSEISWEAVSATLTRALSERQRWPSLGSAARARFESRHDRNPAKHLLKEIENVSKVRA
jgi:glycosyltransferase involved in cell wall biosynthesis